MGTRHLAEGERFESDLEGEITREIKKDRSVEISAKYSVNLKVVLTGNTTRS